MNRKDSPRFSVDWLKYLLLTLSAVAFISGCKSSVVQPPGGASIPMPPSGSPPSRHTDRIRSAHCGTLLACLSRATLPAMNAGARKRNTCQIGKFHGLTANTQPIGS